MPKNKNETLCVEDLRHAEYYEMQNTFDDLYAKSKNGDIFTHLMDIILSRENILLAYRNIKANAGSKTAGTGHKGRRKENRRAGKGCGEGQMEFKKCF